VCVRGYRSCFHNQTV